MKPLHIVYALFTAVSLSGCKVQIIVPEGGRVESASGAYVCESGEACTIDVVDVFFDEIFQAQPAPGYEFVTWRKKKFGFFCGGSNSPCPLNTTQFPGTPLMSALESDQVFYLEPVFGRPDTWVPKARYPGTQPLHNTSTCLVDGIIHVMDTGEGFDYDPASDTWVRKNIRPSSDFSTSNAVNGKCYGIGGGYSDGVSGALSGSPWLTVYDPKTDTTLTLGLDDPSTAPAIPVPRVGHGSAVVDGKVYVLGGASHINWIFNVPGSRGSTPELGPLKSALFIYDPVSDSWSTGSDMPTPRVLLGVTAMDGFIYAVGGAIAGEAGRLGSSPVPTDIVERYDPAKDSWTTLASMPTKRWGLSVNAVDGALYALGGSTTSGWGVGTVATVERYNPKRDKWHTRADMSKKRWLHTSQKVDGQIYVVGGWRRIASTSSGQSTSTTRLTEQYTP